MTSKMNISEFTKRQIHPIPDLWTILMQELNTYIIKEESEGVLAKIKNILGILVAHISGHNLIQNPKTENEEEFQKWIDAVIATLTPIFKLNHPQLDDNEISKMIYQEVFEDINYSSIHEV